MTTVKIKICGLTSLGDALLALAAGADALGFMFYEPSPRYVTFDQAGAIIRRLPPFIAKVGVFVNAPEAAVRRAVAECGLDCLQFHGEETPAFCRRFAPLKVIKAFGIQNADSLAALPAYATDAWLLDSYVPGVPGGTGAQFNWDLALAAKRHGVPIILAGGLGPDNVAEAIQRVRPYGLDVASGVESAPGKKDPAKVRDLIARARAADRA
jgi:phosphoribosylanthranilate isomerase